MQECQSLEEFRNTPEYVELTEKIKCLPWRACAVVNLESQFFNEKIIQIPDKVQARLDRQEVPPYLLRKSLIVSSGVPMLEVGDCWYVHPNEGQWWTKTEVDELGLSIPESFQLRFYGAHRACSTPIEEQILIKAQP